MPINLAHQLFDLDVRIVADDKALRQIWEFDQSAYGVMNNNQYNNISFDALKDWRNAYPPAILGAHITRSLSTDENKAETVTARLPIISEPPSIIAVIGIVPVTEKWCNDFLERRVSEQSLDVTDIAGSAASHWYISGISIDKHCRAGRGLRSFIAQFLQMAFQTWIETSGCSDTAHLELIAEGSTANGRKLLESLDFEMTPLTQGTNGSPRYRCLTTIGQIRTRIARSIYAGRRSSPLHSRLA